MTERGAARKLATESIEAGRPLEWFETLYAQAAGNESCIPWADMTVNPNLSQWLEARQPFGIDQRALVVGCGLGDDAESLSSLGFQVTAFDIAPTCIEWCRQRFPNSSVEYQVANLFNPPAEWRESFDFVVESYTLQVLTPDLRQAAIKLIAEWVAPNGSLLVITRGRNDSDGTGQMPWPLVRSELERFVEFGLSEVQIEDYIEAEDPPVRRFRAEFRRRVATEETP